MQTAVCYAKQLDLSWSEKHHIAPQTTYNNLAFIIVSYLALLNLTGLEFETFYEK